MPDEMRERRLSDESRIILLSGYDGGGLPTRRYHPIMKSPPDVSIRRALILRLPPKIHQRPCCARQSS